MKDYSIIKEDGNLVYVDAVEQIKIQIPSNADAKLICGPEMPKAENCSCIKALENPIDGRRLKDIVKDKKARTASIIVSDSTRGVPTSCVSGMVIQELLEAGIPYENMLIIVGTGLHRKATEQEMRELVDASLYGRVEIISNNAFCEDEYTCIGCSKRGIPIEVNKRAYECDVHVTIGKAELHAMAGFSGGRKSVLPGISSYKTIIGNHSPDMITNICTQRGKLDGNPIHEEMLEAAQAYGVDFCITFVMNESGEIAGVFAGDLDSSHRAACKLVLKYTKVVLYEKPDIFVVTTGRPLNVNLYQASRALRVLDNILDENTVVAFYAECSEGVMSDEMLRPFKEAGSLEDLEEWMRSNWDPRMDDALLFLKSLKTGAKFVCFSPGVEKQVFEEMRCYSVHTLDELLPKAMNLCGKKNPKIAFFPLDYKYFTDLKK